MNAGKLITEGNLKPQKVPCRQILAGKHREVIDLKEKKTYDAAEEQKSTSIGSFKMEHSKILFHYIGVRLIRYHPYPSSKAEPRKHISAASISDRTLVFFYFFVIIHGSRALV